MALTASRKSIPMIESPHTHDPFDRTRRPVEFARTRRLSRPDGGHRTGELRASDSRGARCGAAIFGCADRGGHANPSGHALVSPATTATMAGALSGRLRLAGQPRARRGRCAYESLCHSASSTLRPSGPLQEPEHEIEEPDRVSDEQTIGQIARTPSTCQHEHACNRPRRHREHDKDSQRGYELVAVVGKPSRDWPVTRDRALLSQAGSLSRLGGVRTRRESP